MYKVVEGSNSNHCCFEASVMKEGSDQAICECFHKADAERICAALNKEHSKE